MKNLSSLLFFTFYFLLFIHATVYWISATKRASYKLNHLMLSFIEYYGLKVVLPIFVLILVYLSPHTKFGEVSEVAMILFLVLWISRQLYQVYTVRDTGFQDILNMGV